MQAVATNVRHTRPTIFCNHKYLAASKAKAYDHVAIPLRLPILIPRSNDVKSHFDGINAN